MKYCVAVADKPANLGNMWVFLIILVYCCAYLEVGS